MADSAGCLGLQLADMLATILRWALLGPPNGRSARLSGVRRPELWRLVSSSAEEMEAAIADFTRSAKDFFNFRPDAAH